MTLFHIMKWGLIISRLLRMHSFGLASVCVKGPVSLARLEGSHMYSLPFLKGGLLPLLLCRYNWKTTEWSECRVDTLLSQQDRRRGNQTGLCGGGVQNREVYCVQAPSDMPSNLSALKSKEGSFPGRHQLHPHTHASVSPATCSYYTPIISPLSPRQRS